MGVKDSGSREWSGDSGAVQIIELRGARVAGLAVSVTSPDESFVSVCAVPSSDCVEVLDLYARLTCSLRIGPLAMAKQTVDVSRLS